MRFLESDEADDPILSLVNLIDLFIVVIAILLILIVRNPLSSAAANQRIIMKDAKDLRQYETGSEIGEGQGVKAGVTYQLADGRLIYVPEKNN